MVARTMGEPEVGEEGISPRQQNGKDGGPRLSEGHLRSAQKTAKARMPTFMPDTTRM